MRKWFVNRLFDSRDARNEIGSYRIRLDSDPDAMRALGRQLLRDADLAEAGALPGHINQGTPAPHPPPPAPGGDQFRLTILGDAALMHQIRDAVELQGRLHLGQLEQAYYEIERGMWGALYTDFPEGSVEARSKARWQSALSEFRETLLALRSRWHHAQAHDDQTPFRTERHEREWRAYGLWKTLPWALAKAQNEPLPDDFGIQPGRVTIEKIAPARDANQERNP